MFRRAVIMAAALAMAACADDSGMYDNTPGEALRLSRTAIVVPRAAAEERIGVISKSGEWSVKADKEWLTVAKEKETAVVTIDEYSTEGEEARTATLTFADGSETKTLTVTQWPTEEVMSGRHPECAVNQAVHEEILGPWYYDEEAQTELADYNQSYWGFWNNYLQTLPHNALDGGTWSKGKLRYTYSYIEKNPLGTAAADAPRPGYGMEFDLGTYGGRLVGRVLYVEEGSAAAAAGLKRGDFFDKVDKDKLEDYAATGPRDTALVYKYQYNRVIDSLVHPVEGFSPQLGMLEYNVAAGSLQDRGRTVSITPERRRASPVLFAQTILADDVTTGEAIRTGYLVLTRFDERYEAEIKQAFAGFSGLTHFVLDLRYNRSGTTRMAELVGNLLVPEAAWGMTFARYEFRDAARNKTVTFAPEPTGVRTDTIVVLTGPRTAGASELLINALRGIEPTVKLLVVGESTLGMSVGMVRRQYASETHEYDTYTAAFRPFNAKGEGEYGYGFAPNGGEISEWSGAGALWSTTWGWKERLGSTQDPLLYRAMELITGTSRMPTGGVIPASLRERPGLPREYEYQTNMVMSDE